MVNWGIARGIIGLRFVKGEGGWRCVVHGGPEERETRLATALWFSYARCMDFDLADKTTALQSIPARLTEWLNSIEPKFVDNEVSKTEAALW
jgi:hypothetical protein